ncbi:unnamed protein product, partial [Bubo scandiacus]
MPMSAFVPEAGSRQRNGGKLPKQQPGLCMGSLPWELLLCSSCAAEGTHRRCSNLRSSRTRWECESCAGQGTASGDSSEIAGSGTGSQSGSGSSHGSPAPERSSSSTGSQAASGPSDDSPYNLLMMGDRDEQHSAKQRCLTKQHLPPSPSSVVAQLWRTSAETIKRRGCSPETEKGSPKGSSTVSPAPALPKHEPCVAHRPQHRLAGLARSEASEESGRGSLSPRSPLLGPGRHLPPLQTGSRYGRDRVVAASSLALASLCLSFLLRELVPGQLVPTSGELYARTNNTEKLQGSHKAGFTQTSHQQGDPTGQQGGMAAELPTWLPPSRSETVKESSAESPLENAEESSEESPRKDPLQHLRDSVLLRIPLLSPLSSPPRPSRRHLLRTSEESSPESPLESSEESPRKDSLQALLDSVLLRIPLLSPVSSPPRPSRRHPPRTAQLVEEVPRRQRQVGLTRLLLPLDAVSCRALPGSGRPGGKQAKCPAPARSRRAQETTLWDNIPPKRRKMVEQWVGKHSKTLWEAKPDRDGVAAGSSSQQAGSSKRRASDGNNVPTKRARSLRDARDRDPTGQQGGMAAELPTWLPPSRSETVKESSAESPLENAEESSEESPRKDPLQHLRDSVLLRIPLLSPLSSPPRPSRRHLLRTSEESSPESPLESSEESPRKDSLQALLDSVLLRIPLLSPVSSPPRPSRRHPPRTAQLVEEVPRRQRQVGLTRLLLPLDAVSCRALPGSGRPGGKQAKCPAPARSRRAQETTLWDNIPPKRRKMVEQWVGKHSKTLWEAKPDRDGVAAGSSSQQAGSSKRRASDGNNVPTKRARSLRDARDRVPPAPPTASDRRTEKT